MNYPTPVKHLLELPTFGNFRSAESMKYAAFPTEVTDFPALAAKAIFGSPEAQELYQETRKIDFTPEITKIVSNHLAKFYSIVISTPLSHFATEECNTTKRKSSKMPGSLDNLAREFAEKQVSTFPRLITWNSYEIFAELVSSEITPNERKQRKLIPKFDIELLDNLTFDIKENNIVGEVARACLNRCYVEIFYFTAINDFLEAHCISLDPKVIKERLLPIVTESADIWETLEKKAKQKLQEVAKIKILAEELEIDSAEINKKVQEHLSLLGPLNDNRLRKLGLLPKKEQVIKGQGTIRVTPTAIDPKIELEKKLNQISNFKTLAIGLQRKIVKLLMKTDLDLLTPEILKDLFEDKNKITDKVRSIVRANSEFGQIKVTGEGPTPSTESPLPKKPKQINAPLEFFLDPVSDAISGLPPKLNRQFYTMLEERKNRTPQEFLSSRKIKPISSTKGIYEYQLDVYRFYFRQEESKIIFVLAGDKGSQKRDVSTLIQRYPRPS